MLVNIDVVPLELIAEEGIIVAIEFIYAAVYFPVLLLLKRFYWIYFGVV